MTSRKHIVFVNQNAGYLMIDIINAHVGVWDKITLMTGKIIQRDIPLHPSVEVVHIMAYQRTSTWKRLLTWSIGFLQLVWFIKWKFSKAHLYIVSNPPFATLLPLICSNTYSFLIFDIYPDALVEYKIQKENSFVIKWWKSVNKKLFPKATGIFVLSNGMKKLVGQYVDIRQVQVAPLWTHNDFFKTIPKSENPFVEQHGLMNKLVVLYSGNLGLTHNLEVLIDVAASITVPDILFLIIGDGEKRNVLQQKIDFLKLTNCKLLPWQDVSMLPFSMAAADIGVVSLGKEASLLSVPSKTYNLLSVGVPLLCIADQRSELFELVQQYGCGKCFDGSSIRDIKEFIEKVALDDAFRSALRQKSTDASFDFDARNAFKLVVAPA